MKSLLSRVEFWIILFALIRLVGITNPPLEIGHNWRQSFTCMVARNFHEVEPNILYPRIDYSGDKPGVVASECPVFNYLIFITARVFGWDHWYGRLINLIVSSLGAYYFYLLVKRRYNQRVAFYSCLLLLSSIWFSFARKVMPDTFSVSLVIAGLYYMDLYWENGKYPNIGLFVILAGIGGLSKMPALVLLGIIPLYLLAKEVSNVKRVTIILGTSIVVLLVSLWYFYWQPFLLETFRNPLYFPYSLGEGFRELLTHWPGALKKFYFDAFQSYVAFVIFLFGIYQMVTNRAWVLALTLGFTFLPFVFFVLKTGVIFPTHNYYVIPFVPVMALVGGYGLSVVGAKWWAYLLLPAAIMEGIANQQNDLFVKKSERYKLTLESIADSLSSRSDLIVINGNGNPQQLYLAHRRGWNCNDNELKDSTYLSDITARGCRFAFVNMLSFGDSLHFPVAYQDNHYRVYALKRAP